MIKGKNITKSFDEKLVLNNISFHVKKGSVYGLVGPNGAGKTTLIRTIMGLYSPDAGSIDVLGENVYENTLVKSKIAYIPDDVFYYNSDTLHDLMKFYQSIYDSFDVNVYKKMLEVFKSIDEKKNIRTMSKGMVKQAAFIIAISIRPEILVLDEPIDGLDPVMRRQIFSILMGEVSERQMTVFVSSHNLRELEDICDTVGILSDSGLIEYSMMDLQEDIVKVQVAYPDNVAMPELTDGCSLLKDSATGRIHTLVIKGSRENVEQQLRKNNPVILEFIDVNLEELFIYEMGGIDYEIRDVILS